jgi:hypothetical protein
MAVVVQVHRSDVQQGAPSSNIITLQLFFHRAASARALHRSWSWAGNNRDAASQPQQAKIAA